MNGNREQAGLEFLQWVKKFEPKLYSHIMSQVGDVPNQGIFNMANNLGVLGQNGYVPPTSDGTDNGAFSSWLDKALDTAQKAIPAYFQYKTQSDIMEMNIARAKQGLPPVDPGVVAPQVKVIHDVPPEAQRAISQFKLGGNVLLWGAIALGAFLILRTI